MRRSDLDMPQTLLHNTVLQNIGVQSRLVLWPVAHFGAAPGRTVDRGSQFQRIYVGVAIWPQAARARWPAAIIEVDSGEGPRGPFASAPASL